MDTAERKAHEQRLVRAEMVLTLQKTITNFKSNEVKNYKPTNFDWYYVLTQLAFKKAQ